MPLDAGVDGGADDAGAPLGGDAGAVPELDAGVDAGAAVDAGVDAGVTPPPVEVRGTQLFVDGAPFVARGLIVEGLLIPLRDVNQCLVDYPAGDRMNTYCARHLDSRAWLAGTGAFAGVDMLTRAVTNWNVNTVRFNVLQVALDPSSPYYSTDYLDELAVAVAQARAKNLVTVLALFDSPANDDPYWKSRYPKLSLDDAVTEAAARTLAQRFGNDPHVFLELLNEPYLARTDRAVRWGLWRDGGSVNYGPFANHPFVGVNRIIQTVRATGARNPIIVQPPSATFEGFPGGVTDPLGLVLYASHPFLNAGDDDEVNWQLRFGEFARTHPYLQTAWNVNTEDPWCSARGATLAQKYLNYLGRLGVGAIGFALDVNGSVIVNFQTKLDKASKVSPTCGTGGGGELLQTVFTGTLADLGNQPPVAGALSAPASASVGQLVSVSVSATDADQDPCNFQLDWGDGTSTALQAGGAFEHTWSAAGTYLVRLRVVDARGGEAMASSSIVVH